MTSPPDSGGARPKPPNPPYSFYDHAVYRMNQRGVSPAGLQAVLDNPVDVRRQSNGNIVYIGHGGLGVIVDDATGQIVTVLGRPS